MPSFSLVGALEFRQVIAGLQAHATSNSLSMFESPVTPYAGGHYHRHPRSGSHSPLSEVNPWDAALGMPMDNRSPRLLVNDSIVEGHEPSTSAISTQAHTPISVPSISHTQASPTDVASTTTTEVEPHVPPSKRERIWCALKQTYHILLPALHNFKQKTLLGKIASLLAAPAVMALTLTLPVVVVPYDSNGSTSEKWHRHHHHSGSELVEFEEEGIERALIAEEVVQPDLHEMQFNKWLMAAQCVLGPLFCVAVLLRACIPFLQTLLKIADVFSSDDVDQIAYITLGTVVCGLAIATLVLVFSDGGSHPTLRMVRCSMGFLVAIAWIMAIADEAVNVLQVRFAHSSRAIPLHRLVCLTSY